MTLSGACGKPRGCLPHALMGGESCILWIVADWPVFRQCECKGTGLLLHAAIGCSYQAEGAGCGPLSFLLAFTRAIPRLCHGLMPPVLAPLHELVCSTSSPAVEASVRQLAKDLQRANGRWAPIYASTVEYQVRGCGWQPAASQGAGAAGMRQLRHCCCCVCSPAVAECRVQLCEGKALPAACLPLSRGCPPVGCCVRVRWPLISWLCLFLGPKSRLGFPGAYAAVQGGLRSAAALLAL